MEIGYFKGLVVIMYMYGAVECNYVYKFLFYMHSAVDCAIEWWTYLIYHYYTIRFELLTGLLGRSSGMRLFSCYVTNRTSIAQPESLQTVNSYN